MAAESRTYQTGPLPRLIAAPLRLAYEAVLAQRNRAFDAGRRVVKLPIPVISVGNLSVGGTGKTPMAMLLIEWLIEAGAAPCIAMRGYRKRGEGMSDEEAEYRAAFPGLKIVAQPDRLAGLRPLIERREVGCIVLDDGFQHRRIARDLDIVLIDATRSPFEDRCLPEGWLREPARALARASGDLGAVVLTRTDLVKVEELGSLRGRITGLTGAAPAEAEHQWSELRAGRGEAGEGTAPALPGLRVVIACAIGNPGAFIQMAERAGLRVDAVIVERDHHPWSERDVRAMLDRARESGSILTTEKDWAKIGPIMARMGPHPDVVFICPRLRMRIVRGEEELRARVLRAARR